LCVVLLRLLRCSYLFYITKQYGLIVWFTHNKENLTNCLEKVKKLQSKTMVDFETFKVVPTRFISPLHLFASCEKEISQLVWNVVCKPQPLLTHHARNGFALSKVMRRSTTTSVGRRPEVMQPQAGDCLGLMSKIQPETTQEAARVHQEAPLACSSRCCRAPDQPDAERCGPSWESQVRSLHEDAEAAQEGKEEESGLDFKSSTTTTEGESGLDFKSSTTTTSPGRTMRVRGFEEVLFFITSHAPAAMSIHPDASNCRWFRGSISWCERGSISWCERGHSLAAGMCFHQLWSLHMEASFGEPPFQLASLLPVGPAARCLQHAE
jgi:hypothetical protein